MAEENTLKSIEHSVELSAENAQKVKEMGNDLIDKLSEKVEEGAERLDELRKEMNKRASGIGTPTEKFEKKIEDEVSEMLKETKEKLNDTVKNVDFSGVFNNLTTFDEETQEKVSETFADIKDGMERFVDEMDKSISEKVDGLEESEKMERRTESENENIGGIISEKSTDFEEVCKETIVADRLEETVENKLAESVDDKIISEKVDTIGNENVKGEKEEEGGGANKMDELVNETFEKFQKLNVEAQMKLADAEEIIDEKLHNLKEGIDEKINEINMKTGKEVENNIICRSDKGEKIKADNDNIEKSEFTQERSIVAVDNDHLGSEDINHLQDSTLNNDIETVQGNTGESMIKLEHVEEKKAIKKIVPPGEDVPQQVGTISKSGTYHDDYETEKSEAIGSATLEDIVSEKVDVVDKLLEEAFNISEKMKEPETIEDVIKQQEIQGEEVHDFAIDLNVSNMATVDIKSEIKSHDDKERNVTPQFSPISEQTKDSSEAAALESCEKSLTAGEEESKHEMKLAADPKQYEENVKSFSKQDVVEVSKVEYEISDSSSNNIPPPVQSSTSPEDTPKFLVTVNAVENALQSATVPIIKGNDHPSEVMVEPKIKSMQEKSEPEHQSAKTNFTEKSVNRSSLPNCTSPLSPEGALPVRAPKNVPPPVPPKKKSIEMILAEEAKAMRQRSLRGFETVVQGVISPEIGKDELKSKQETKQNIETPPSQEQVEAKVDKSGAKHETVPKSEPQKTDTSAPTQIQKSEAQMADALAPTQIQKSEAQMTDTPAPTQIQKSEAQMTDAPAPTQIQKSEAQKPKSPTAQAKPETSNAKEKTDTMKSKNGDGQHQQSRRCTIL